MFIVGTLALSAADNGGMRPLLLVLLMIAVILIFVGSVIALLTLRNQRKNQFARIATEQSNREKE